MKIISAADSSFVPASHENPNSPGVLKKVLFRKGDLLDGTIQMVNWAKLPVGRGFAAHYHQDMQEVYILLSGVAQLTIDQETMILHRGDAVVIDPLEVHQMRNDGDQDAEFLAMGIAMGQDGQTVLVPSDT